MEQAVQTTETKEKRVKNKPNKPKKRGKLKKRWIVLGVLVVLVAVVVVMCNNAAQSMMSGLLSFDDTTLIENTDLTYSISATGTVVSVDTHNVYSTQAYTVQNVYVKVGDSVQEGDELCKLDSGALEDQIEKKELAIGVSAESAAQQVKAARDTYNAARDALDEGLNASLISAQSQVDNAYNNWVKAQKTYDEYVTSLNLGENSQILSQERAVTTARDSLTSAQREYDNAVKAANDARAALNSYPRPAVDEATAQANVAAAMGEVQSKQFAADHAKGVYENLLKESAEGPDDVVKKSAAENAAQAYSLAQGELSKAESDLAAAQQVLASLKGTDTQYKQLQSDYDTKASAVDTRGRAVRSAQEAYDNAIRQYNATLRTSDNSLSDYATAVETAQQTYQTALESLAAAQNSADTQLQSSRNTVKSTEISANNDLSLLELAQMQEDLEKTTITAPTSGTITAVYAKVGNSGSGLLFVIEDTENLLVETTVKEYDIGTVTVGLPVTIRSDATGDEVIDGRVDNISPASKKNAAGAVDTTGDVVFPTDVAVLTKGTGLRIGMSVRLNYIIEQKEGVLAVPYEAVYTNAATGEACVLTLTDQGDGKYLISELPVTAGMETDLSIEVSGANVSAGLRVINSPSTYMALVGQAIPLSDQRAAAEGFTPPFMR